MAWQPDGTGVQFYDGGGMGGDLQVTGEWSVRFRHTVQDKAVVTVYGYGIQERERAPYRVELLVEYIVCKDVLDPGGTEEWSDYHRLQRPGGYTNEHAVSTAARDAVRDFTVDDIEWDGCAPWEK